MHHLRVLLALVAAASALADVSRDCQAPHGSVTSALIQHASTREKDSDQERGLGLKQGLGLQLGKGETKQGQRSIDRHKKMLWISSLSVAPQCHSTESYMDQYEIALISWAESGNRLFQPMLACHLPQGTEQSDLSTWIVKRLDRFRHLGANISFHTMSFIDRMHAVPKVVALDVDVECLAGTFMRLDIPQILDNSMALSGAAGMMYDSRHVLYTDLDILWWRKVTPTELLESAQKKWYAAAYSSQLRKDEGPRNAGVILFDLPNYRSIQPQLLAWAFGVNPVTGKVHMSEVLGTSRDQGVLNHFFDTYPGRAFLQDKWNYKMFWAGSNSTAIVHYWAVKPSDGLRCFVKKHSQEDCEEISSGLIPEKSLNFQRDALSIALSVDENLTFLQEVMAAYDHYAELRNVAFIG